MTFEEIRKAIADQLGIAEEKVTMDSNLVDDLNADSLDVVELMMDLEENSGVEIRDEDLVNIKTVGDIVKYIEEHKE